MMDELCGEVVRVGNLGERPCEGRYLKDSLGHEILCWD